MEYAVRPLQLEADSQAVALAMYKDGEQTIILKDYGNARR